MKNKTIVVILAALATLALYKIGENVLKLGDGTATDKEIVADIGNGATNPKLSYSTSSSAWEFSNDGATSQPFGSGSGGGGGINLVENDGFELSTNNWTNTGTGTFAVTTTASNVGIGDASGDWDAAAAADKLASDAISVPNIMSNRQCHADFSYKGGDANITAQVVDGATVLSSLVLEAQTEFRTISQLVFPCPDSSGTLAMEFVAGADAAVIYIDQVFFGMASLQQGALGGWKQYDGSDANITAAGWSLDFAYYVPYKDPFTGQWRMSFNFNMTKDSGDESANVAFAIEGVTFAAGRQGLAATETSSTISIEASTDPSSGNVTVGRGGGSNFNVAHVSGDVLLTGKPTWAGPESTVSLTNEQTVYQALKENIEGHAGVALNTGVEVTLAYTTVIKGSNYNVSNGEFTAPADGEYFFTSFFTVSGVRNMEHQWTKNATIVKLKNNTAAIATHESNLTADLLKGDTVKLVIKNLGANANIAGGSNQNIFTIKRNVDYSAGNTSGQPFADEINRGLVRLNKWQLKSFTGTATSATDLITFNNLITGKLYKLSAQVRGNAVGLNRARIRENGVILGYMEAAEAGGSGYSSSFFIATGTVATVDWLSGTISGGGTPDQTFAILEEITNYGSETNDFD